MKDKTSEYSAEIKTEILQIVEVFNLGKFIEFVSFQTSIDNGGFICTQFETSKGVYFHYYKIKNYQDEDLKNIEKRHEKLRDILIDYGCEEHGDCIIDEISELFDYPNTNVYYNE